MTERDFELENEGKEKYEYSYMDKTCRVSFNGFNPGDLVGVHCYGEGGEKMGYFSFNISNVDNKTIHYRRKENEDPPSAVIAAIHSSGWIVNNVNKANFKSEKDLPKSIELLNIRDSVKELAKNADGEFQKAQLNNIVNIIESAAVVSLDMENLDDPDEWITRNLSQRKQFHPDPADIESFDDMVYGYIKTIVDPTVDHRAKYHSQYVNKIELGRDLFISGGIDKEKYFEYMNDLDEL